MELFFILSILLTSSCTISRFIILHDMHENYSMLNSEELIHFDQWKYMIPFYNLYLYHNHIPLLEEEKEKYLSLADEDNVDEKIENLKLKIQIRFRLFRPCRKTKSIK